MHAWKAGYKYYLSVDEPQTAITPGHITNCCDAGETVVMRLHEHLAVCDFVTKHSTLSLNFFS